MDIVALSGLNSHAYGSWVGPKVDNVAPMWLQDFLSKDNNLKYCRTMIFGYNTKYYETVRLWIEDHADNLLIEVNKARSSEAEQRRPLALMGHSFGGTVITHALFSASIGNAQIYLEDVIAMLDEEDIGRGGHELVQGIAYETGRVTTTVRAFKKQIKDMEIRLFSFYEMDKTPKVAKLPGGGYSRCGDLEVIVGRSSAELDIPDLEELLPAPGNHSTIVKFVNEQHQTYQTIHKRLNEVIAAATAVNRDLASSGSKFALQNHQREMISEIRKQIPSAENAAFDSYQDDGLDSRCHTGTRTELLSQIKEWAEDLQGKCMFWLNGMAGTGKSTISRTLAQIFEEDGRLNPCGQPASGTGPSRLILGASFFFKRGESDRDNPSRFFTTIATQLLPKLPDLIPHIRAAIDEDPDIATKSLDKQFKNLIFHPLEKLSQGVSTPAASRYEANKTPRPIVLVIDALDECDGDERIRQVLHLIAKLQTLKTVHMRVFLTSRPELPVRLGFGDMSPDSYKDVILQNIPSIGPDIFVFLDAKFSEIKSSYNKCMTGDPLPSGWPGEENIKKLTKMAIPLFIFAATICRFVGDKMDWDPEQKLKTVLDGGGAGASQLDQTYLPVLKRLEAGFPKQQLQRQLFEEEFRQILGSIILLADPLSISSLANLLNKPQGEVSKRLQHLYSVLSIPQNTKLPIRLLHLSFREFLVDSTWSGKSWFWINKEDTHSMITTKCLNAMSMDLKQNICSLEFPGVLQKDIDANVIDKCLPAHLQYACCYWVFHLKESRKLISDNSEVYTFLCNHFLSWIEALSIIGKLSGCISLVDTLCSITDTTGGTEAANFLYDARRFLLQNWRMISHTPLQLYSSAIIFAPATSIIRTKFRDHIPKGICTLPKVTQSWNAELQVIGDHSDWVKAVAFSPDGKWIVSGSNDQTVRLWDAITGEEVKRLEGHSSSVQAVAFSPDGKRVVFGVGRSNGQALGRR
ncbi:hypothetical protein TWF718_005345 [Orbilia javanica]|uniref:Nephrocystin 3-like N-terminal domain-containing protein n=1 Tax=Orbilia javanica TaxID=47235 RepID=A0AAN8MU55_9PEZI